MMSEVFVGRDQNLETLTFCRVEQFAVFES